MNPVKRALISVSNKDHLVPFAKALQEEFGVTIVSTGNTARTLKEAGLSVTLVSEVTGFEEILDGRVKTLHPKIHGGLLAKRSKESHLEQLKKYSIEPFDMVVVNLYPFRETVAKPGVTIDDACENIDIGGPAMVRASAKNFQDVAIAVNPDNYAAILEELRGNEGCIGLDLRRKLATQAFAHTASYDAAITHYLQGLDDTGATDLLKSGFLDFHFERVQDLRYGENPHQRAVFYRDPSFRGISVATASILHGKEVSFNNLVDVNAAWNLVLEFEEPAAVIIKHTNPCGAAMAHDLLHALEAAHQGDPVSAFGGIVALNRSVGIPVAEKLNAMGFLECVIAPDYTHDALELLKTKANRRLLATFGTPTRPDFPPYDMKFLPGGLLLQDADNAFATPDTWKTVTQRHPSKEELASLSFAWRVGKHTKSNAIVLVNETKVVGTGAGQMSRVDSSDIAIKKAGSRTQGAVAASDAFFPFPDALVVLAQAGVTAVAQPGGSIRDDEVIAAADEAGMAMVFTGQRHFRH